MATRLPPGPLYHFDRENNTIVSEWTGDFYLNASMYVEDNVRLDVIGIEYDGDVNRFLLVSARGAWACMETSAGISSSGHVFAGISRHASYKQISVKSFGSSR